MSRPLRVAFIHPDLGIGGAERLVVDAALGLQKLGHSVDIYTSYHDPNHCFEETRDGTLSVHHISPPLPRALFGKLHILFAHLRQLHLTTHLLFSDTPKYDAYFVDQLSTCVPFLRSIGNTRVVFYCHFPDKLLANGAFVEGRNEMVKKGGLLKRLYRMPMDWLEEVTTRQADIILANSGFTSRVFKAYFPSITQTPRIVYPGINISAYEAPVDHSDPDIAAVSSSRPTLLSLNRFEGKKNAMLALEAFGLLKSKRPDLKDLRLVLAGGYDSRLDDNIITLDTLICKATALSLTYNIQASHDLLHQYPVRTDGLADVLFLLNFTTAQRTGLLTSPHSIALLYTPANEHFGIVPIEAMACGVPVLACNSGGPTESVLSSPPYEKSERTGWLEEPLPEEWLHALEEIVDLPAEEREAIGARAKRRAREKFGMEAMSRGLEDALRDAVNMGRVESRFDNFFGGTGGTVFFVLVGFLIAYLAAPFLLPTS